MNTGFEERKYRNLVQRSRGVTFRVAVKETDLCIHAERDLQSAAREAVIQCRGYIESYIARFPGFARTMSPWRVDGMEASIIHEMSDAGRKANVGPMAAVAGAVAQFAGTALLNFSSDVIVENGGDIFIRSSVPVLVGVFSGKSPLSMKMGIKIPATSKPVGVCTSSGTLGHSFSLGEADAACVRSESCALSDASATAIGNLVKTERDITAAIDYGKNIQGVTGVLIIKGKKMGVWGDLELTPLNGKKG